MVATRGRFHGALGMTVIYHGAMEHNKDGAVAHPYEKLGPGLVLDAIEAAGYRPDGRLLALNSYENRVYQVGIEDGPTLVTKFYRPGRWNRAAILEEHDFAIELVERDIPVVAPMADSVGRTLREYANFLYAIYPRQGGHWPELQSSQDLTRMGRFLGRLHAVGAIRRFGHRPQLSIEEFGVASVEFVLAHGFVPQDLVHAYRTLTDDLLVAVRAAFERAGPYSAIRLHGDCHPGNVLWTDDGPHFVDLDDACSGPAIQDLWMLLSGERAEMNQQLGALLDGYSQFYDFEPRQLHLVEALRTLRMLRYSAWLARRWDDPAFPHTFPWFGQPRYWEEQILALREQAALLTEPPLVWS